MSTIGLAAASPPTSAPTPGGALAVPGIEMYRCPSDITVRQASGC